MSTTVQLQKIGQIVEISGVVAFTAGLVVSAHHYAIGALFVAGAVALVVGKKLRGQ